MTVIYVILLFVLMIFPHELGHFIAAKACRVQVNEFAFGMGPALFKKQGRETLSLKSRAGKPSIRCAPFP